MSKVIYHLFVNGVPKAQPRPRLGANGKVFNPKSADSWKLEVQAAFLSCRKQTITAPVLLKVNFYLPRPKSIKGNADTFTPHASKPDIDNLLKSTLDSMTGAKVWKDDALVYSVAAYKWYAGKKTGAQIIVETIN